MPDTSLLVALGELAKAALSDGGIARAGRSAACGSLRSNLGVAFVGKRRKQYTNQPASTITINESLLLVP